MSFVDVLITIVQVLVITLAITTGFAYLTLFERRLLARFQHRVGPNRAGPSGFLQPVADAVKLFFKEDVIPRQADRAVYILAPALAVITALVIWAVIPFGCLNINFDVGFRACYEPAQAGELHNLLQMAEVNIGVLYLLAITSVGVYGITLAGWASNSKYAMLGGIRSAAQLISYELALGMAVLGAVMVGGTLGTNAIVQQQHGLWIVFPQLLGFVLFVICGIAELVRAPFDLVEAEQELTSGYNTEYGSMKFALFFMAEYIKMIAIGAMAATLFLGGWNFPGLYTLGAGVEDLLGVAAGAIVVGLVSLGAFLIKVVAFLFLLVWLRATLPRVRYDRLMDLGWKTLLPLAVWNLTFTPVVIVLLPDQPYLQAVVLFGISLLTLVAVAGLGSRQGEKPGSRLRLVRPAPTTRTGSDPAAPGGGS